MTDPRDSMRWLRRGSALAILVIGWVFIAWQNHFHVTAPMVFVCLGYLAVVATVYNLWRTGAAAVDGSEDMADSTWAKPTGALGELEREKRTLLKAIKEAEFDHQMGKLSQRDADEMIRGYRARAIEVIKQIDQLGLGAAGSVREQILREVRARIQLDGKSSKKAGAKAGAKAGSPAGTPITAERRWRCPKCAAVLEKAGIGIVMIPGESAEVLKGNGTCAKCGASFPQASIYGGAFDVRGGEAAKTEDGGGKPAELPAADAASPEPFPAEAGADAAPPAGAAPAAQAARAVQRPSDDELDADSTTAIEPRRGDSAKEATP